MTEQKHTPEPWRIEPATKKGNWRIVGANGQVVSIFSGSFDMANARRIVAAVNACAGIDTEDLERHYNAGGGIDSAMEEAALRDHVKVWQQSDKLRAALQNVVDAWSSQFERQGHLAPEWCKQARAALAATE